MTPPARRTCALRLPSTGLAKANPRRAGLAPLDTADQAAHDRPAQVAEARCARLGTSIQACRWHARALTARLWVRRSSAVGREPKGVEDFEKNYFSSTESTHLNGAMAFLFGYQSSAVDPLSA